MSVNPPLSEGPLGNTIEGQKKNKSKKCIKEVKRFCFTLNNYSEEEYKNIINTLNTLSEWVIGKEVGAQGTPHLQGYFQLEKKKSFSSMKNILKNDRIHLEACKGSHESNIKYCTKEKNWDSNFLEKPFIQEIENFYEWELQIMKILEDEPDTRTLYYYFEKEGCKGKTTFQKYLFTHYEDCIILSGKGADMKNGIVNYYQSKKKLPKLILINIPRESYDYVSWTGVEEVKDMCFYSGKYEGGMICGKCPFVFMFANEPPPIKKVSIDRWKIYHIKNNMAIDWDEEI